MLDYRAHYQNPATRSLMPSHHHMAHNPGMLANPSMGTWAMIIGGVVLVGGLGYLGYVMMSKPATPPSTVTPAANPMRQRSVRRVA